MASLPGPLLESTWSTPFWRLGGGVFTLSIRSIRPSLCHEAPRQGRTLRLFESMFRDAAFDPVCSILPGALNLFSLSKNNAA